MLNACELLVSFNLSFYFSLRLLLSLFDMVNKYMNKYSNSEFVNGHEKMSYFKIQMVKNH